VPTMYAFVIAPCAPCILPCSRSRKSLNVGQSDFIVSISRTKRRPSILRTLTVVEGSSTNADAFKLPKEKELSRRQLFVRSTTTATSLALLFPSGVARSDEETSSTKDRKRSKKWRSPLSLPLNNRYFIVRHGQSRANAEGIVISDSLNGASYRWGLTDLGKEEARLAAQRVAELAGGGRVLIYTSDFRRAEETAEIIQREIQGELHYGLELRERFFGELEGAQADQAYPIVWAEDEKDPSSRYRNAESVIAVYGRALSLLQTLERSYTKKRVVLVSHGDPLQILQCGLAGDDLRHHRDYAIKTGEVREVLPLASAVLPILPFFIRDYPKLMQPFVS